MAFTLLFDYGNVHYLNKRECPLHSKRTSILRDEATLKFKLNQCQVPSIAHGRLFSLFFKNNFINLIVVYIFCYNQGCQISIDFDNQKPAFLKDCERFHKDKLQRCETKLKESDRNKKKKNYGRFACDNDIS